MADESKKMNWGKIAMGFGLTFAAAFAACAVWSLTEEHLMGGKKVKAIAPTAPAAPKA